MFLQYRDVYREIIANIIKENKDKYIKEKVIIKINIIVNRRKFKDIQDTINKPIETEWLDVKDNINIISVSYFTVIISFLLWIRTRRKGLCVS